VKEISKVCEKFVKAKGEEGSKMRKMNKLTMMGRERSRV